MLDIRYIRENSDAVKLALDKRGSKVELDPILELDARRRSVQQEVEQLKQRRNEASKQIGLRKRAGEDISGVTGEMKELSMRISTLDHEGSELNEKLQAALLTLPNCPVDDAPIGPDESGNVEVRTWGTKKTFDFEPLPHWELGERLNLFDFPRATRMSGSGFPLFRGAGARLQRGLIQFLLDLHTNEHGYEEIWPPYLVNADAMTGTGQLPKMAEDMYFSGEDGLYLIPTAEVPVTNMYREEIIDVPLPICMTAYTPCFRREAGAAGKDTRGLNRVHQFDKVELVKIVEPSTSPDEHMNILAHAETVLQRLNLPYRVLELCTGDLSFAAARCFDLELWAPGQNTWLEVSSVSNFCDFQARRAGIRYRNEDGKVAFPHTLNGSGVALPRLVVALLENGQQSDGSIDLPEVLHPYLSGMTRIEPR